jgi:hypothetical protein
VVVLRCTLLVSTWWRVNVDSVSLHTAASADKSMLQVLLNAGAFVGVSDCDGATPLHYAAVAHAVSGAAVVQTDAATVDRAVVGTVQLLVERGAYVGARDGAGDTPLHWAARECNSSSARALLDARADASLRNDDGETPRVVCDVAMAGAMAVDDANERSYSARCADLIDNTADKKLAASADSAGSSSFGAPKYMIFV